MHISLKTTKTGIAAFLMLFFLILENESLAQQSESQPMSKTYISWIFTADEKIVGNLVDVQDAYLEISELGFGKTGRLTKVESSNIDMIKLRRKGNPGRGLFLGGLSGALFGGIVGLMSGDDPSNEFISFKAEDKALILGAFFAIPGTIIGGVIGAKRIKIPIRNQQQNYLQQKELIAKYKRY